MKFTTKDHTHQKHLVKQGCTAAMILDLRPQDDGTVILTGQPSDGIGVYFLGVFEDGNLNLCVQNISQLKEMGVNFTLCTPDRGHLEVGHRKEFC